MAGDWIKMRGALYDHPKVIAIAHALNGSSEFREWLTPRGSGPMNGQTVSNAALRGVTTGLLLKVWSAAREHGKFDGDDLVLAHSGINDLDEMAGAPGVGEAMKTVGWAIAKRGVILPNFKQFNVPMTNAERQRAFRENRSNDSVTPKSRGHRYIHVTREEKRREEGKPSSVVDVSRTSSSHFVAACSARKGAPLPDDWMLPEEWRTWALACQPSWTAGHVNLVAAQFRDYWIAQPGQRACKRNWLATWRNWVRREPATGEPKPAQESSTVPASLAPPEDDPPY
jgi:hypothetical protein